MIEIKRYKKNAKLLLDGIKLEGSYSKNFISHPEMDIILFDNCDEENDKKRLYFYDLIKNIEIAEIPDDVQFNIISVFTSEPIPAPLDKVPFPFDSITIGNDNKGHFFVRFNTTTDESDTENWNIKWASDFYFRSLSEIDLDKDIKIFEIDKNIFREIFIQFELPKAGIISNAVQLAICKIKTLLHKVEIKLNGLDDFFNAIEIWDKNISNKSEKFWQKTLTNNSWILSQCFNSPLIIFQREAFLGGKGINNKDGKIIDFILQNKLTHNLSLIEIKTPNSRLTGRKYRNVFTISEDLTGAMCQLLDYKEQLLKDFYSLKSNSISDFKIFNPKLLLIAGSLRNMTNEEKKAFELFRLDMKSIEIITFDELFEKIFMQIELLNKKYGLQHLDHN
jgi:hypothetical protein